MAGKKQDNRANARRGKVTLRHIADDLGVSKATVSLAINGSDLVADKTRARVLEKIEELGYIYNRGAAGLSTGTSRTIGLAVHDITNPYFSELSASVEAVLSLRGRLPFLCNTGESLANQTRFIEALCGYNADGLIICPATGTDLKALQPLLQQHLPTVVVIREIEGANLDFVGNDEFRTFRLAAEHLIGLGHRRIAVFGGSRSTPVGRARRAGFDAGLRAAGVAPDPSLMIDCEINPTGGEAALRAVLDRGDPPSAALCYTDHVALGAISALYERDLRPGVDFALMGCDGIEEGERAYARLSTIHIRKSTIGQLAAETLLERLENPDMPLKRIVLEPELVIRESCGTVIDNKF